MRLIPVMDLWQGEVVYGTGGCRVKHRSIATWMNSQLTTSSEPLAVAEGFRKHLGLTELYLVDLDAASSPQEGPRLPIYQALQAQGFRLWVDAGVSGHAQALALAEAGVSGIVVGLSTLAIPPVLPALCREFGDRVVFSLAPDGQWVQRDENPLNHRATGGVAQNLDLAAKAVAAGVRRLIIPDLDPDEGQENGGALELCQRLVEAHPGVAVVAGGDVYKTPDLPRWRQVGAVGVLCSLALHGGAVRREDLGR